MKTCSVCGLPKPESEFYFHRYDKKSYIEGCCKKCNLAKSRDKQRETMRARRAKKETQAEKLDRLTKFLEQVEEDISSDSISFIRAVGLNKHNFRSAK